MKFGSISLWEHAFYLSLSFMKCMAAWGTAHNMNFAWGTDRTHIHIGNMLCIIWGQRISMTPGMSPFFLKYRCTKWAQNIVLFSLSGKNLQVSSNSGQGNGKKIKNRINLLFCRQLLRLFRIFLILIHIKVNMRPIKFCSIEEENFIILQ